MRTGKKRWIGVLSISGSDDRVERLVATVLDAARLDEAGVHVVAELGDDEVADGCLSLLLAVHLDQLGDTVGARDALDPPECLIALADGPGGQLHGLGPVLLEHEAELALAAGAVLDLAFEIRREVRIRGANLAEQVSGAFRGVISMNMRGSLWQE